METGCSFPCFAPSPLPNASVFPHLFFPVTICSSPLLKFWLCSLSLNKDDKSLKPVPIWKGTLCLIPLPSVRVPRVEERGWAGTATSPLLFSPCVRQAWRGPISCSTSGSGLGFVGPQELLPATASAMPALSFCLLCRFTVAGTGTVGLMEGVWAAAGPQQPMHTGMTAPAACSYCTPALWPSTQVVCLVLLNV